MNNIIIKNKRSKISNIEKEFPGAVIVDVTSKGEEPWVKFSPFYPHGGIPVPFSGSLTATSVEGIWQGLKVFEREGIDCSKFSNNTMKNIKRSIRKCGPIIGHQRGTESEDILSYVQARKEIYIPSYEWVLKNCVKNLVENLRKILIENSLVLLDYQTNSDVEETKTPLSHASLVKNYLGKTGL